MVYCHGNDGNIMAVMMEVVVIVVIAISPVLDLRLF